MALRVLVHVWFEYTQKLEEYCTTCSVESTERQASNCRLKGAEEEIVSFAQREEFREEYTALSLGKTETTQKSVDQANSCIDEDDVIWCDGRLKFAEVLPYDTTEKSNHSASGTLGDKTDCEELSRL